jgi:adenine-specific DNA-methyltransferase
VGMMGRYKKVVEVEGKPHRYHFGTHASVERSQVTEYLIIGSD